MRALLTGISGFVGSHMAELLVEHHPDVEVHGTVRARSRRDNLAGFVERLHLVECDLQDANGIADAVRSIRPDAVVHLAAQSYVPASWSSPADTYTANIVGQVNLLEALRKHAPEASIVVVGSSEEYGLARPDELPIRETNPLRPISPYAVSKVAQDLMGFQYHHGYGLRIVRTRAFNHTGPRRGESFAESSFARQIAEIELGLCEPVLRVGNLESRRDFTDVRDVVRAYWLLLQRGVPGEVYNVASGHSIRMAELLEMMLGKARRPIRVEPDPARFRPGDVSVVEADCSRLREATGWEPSIPLARTVEDILEDWRGRVARSRIPTRPTSGAP